MKKLFLLLLVLFLSLMCAACSGTKEEPKSEETTAVPDYTPQEMVFDHVAVPVRGDEVLKNNGLAIANDLSLQLDNVTVAANVPLKQVSYVDASVFDPHIDLSGITSEGIYDIKISYKQIDPDYGRVISITPDTVRINVMESDLATNNVQPDSPSSSSVPSPETSLVPEGTPAPAASDETDYREVEITACMLDDLSAHRILIPGEDGTSIYIRELRKSYPVVGGYAIVEVADHVWYDDLDTVSDDSMEVILTPYLKTSEASQASLPVISYVIDIPQSPISLESPESLRTVFSGTMAEINIVVRPGSRVTVNGVDCSDTVNSKTGEMTYNAIVQPIGDNVFNIVVRSRYCRENTLQVVLYREPQEIPLDLAAGTYGTTNNKVMKVTATTLPGAFVEVTTPYSDMDITELNTSGKFTFNAVFDHIGNNTITIIATYPGKKPSRVDHTVYYVPSVDIYTKKAWALDARNYGDLIDRIAVLSEKNQVYVVKGIVQSQISEKPQMVIINSSDDGKSQPVVLENKTKKKWKVGEYYRVYADADLMYNGMPHLLVRFSYDKDGK